MASRGRRGRRRPHGATGRTLALAGVAAALLSAAGCAALRAPGRPAATVATAAGAPVPEASTATGRRPSPSPSPSADRPLAGKIVGIDPGHNGLNYTNPAFLTKQIWNGRQWEDCDTTGTRTASGYTEARFNFQVARYLTADLRRLGATVVLTRHGNHGLGPCVTTRSLIINRAHANVAIDIHADGGPPSGRGFTVLEPVADGPNNAVIASSARFGQYVHRAFIADTPMRVSDYYGTKGYIARNDLAGLNLTTVPKVLIECGNMTNSADAALLTSPRVQRKIARALGFAIVRYLTGHWPAGSLR